VFFQQLINGLALGFHLRAHRPSAIRWFMASCVHQFAHSDVLMLGAFAAYFLAPASRTFISVAVILGCVLVTAWAAGICATLGILIEFASLSASARPAQTHGSHNSHRRIAFH